MFLIEDEATFRLSLFLGVLILMALWELATPMRDLTVSRRLRWSSNLGLITFNALILRLVLPITAVGAAVMAQENGWGLFHLLDLSLYPWMVGVITIVLLDLTVYSQHVLFHAVPLFWRLHMVHHADPNIDVTTGLRFHTLEILISMGIKIMAILALGPPAWAVILFEMILNATAMFNHSNIRLPGPVDHILRLFLVTPDMHRVHHSVDLTEANMNFGFNLPWWDRLFRTYRAQPFLGHQRMTIGIANLSKHRVVRLPWMLLLPFNSTRDNSSSNDLKQ